MSVIDRSARPAILPRLIGRLQGHRPGPTLICIGAMHGNEPAGVRAAGRVLERLSRACPDDLAGCIVGLIGNVSALCDPDPHLRYRQSDLNRICTPENADRVRATDPGSLTGEMLELRQLLDALEGEFATAHGPVFLMDMHTVSSPSPPFAAIEDSLPARRFVRRFGLPLLLGFEEELPGMLTDLITNRYGHVCCLIEGGTHDDPASVAIHEAAIWLALDAGGLLPGSIEHEHDPARVLRRAAGRLVGRVYDVRHRQTIASDDFRIRPGLHAYGPVHAGRTPIADQGGRPIIAPISGLLVMPNRQARARVGDDAFFIVRRVGRAWLALSAMLRRLGWLHRLLPNLAPGVRRCPDREACLLVSPHIAPVLKRQVFHLLGYRLLRHGPEVHLPVHRRIARGIMAVLASARIMLHGLARGGEPRAIPTAQPDDWIVAKRTLDRRPPAR